MISCRYVGSDSSEIGDREFEAVGQRAVFSEEGYREAVLGGAAFIVDEDFERVGFSEDELMKYGPVGVRVNPSASFCDKLIVAQDFFREIRNRMLAAQDQQRVLAEVAGVEPAVA